MAIRDPRIHLVVEFAGPTDFFGPYVRTIVENALDGQLTSLPGMVDLNEQFIQPLAAGTLSANAFRLELVRRSPVLFAARLPATQAHHGTLDTVAHVGQAESLIAALGALGPPGDETQLYAGAGHSLLEMEGSPARAIAFLDRLVA